MKPTRKEIERRILSDLNHADLDYWEMAWFGTINGEKPREGV